MGVAGRTQGRTCAHSAHGVFQLALRPYSRPYQRLQRIMACSSVFTIAVLLFIALITFVWHNSYLYSYRNEATCRLLPFPIIISHPTRLQLFTNFHLLCYAALLKFSPIMLTILHCAQHYAHLQCKKAIIKQLHTIRDPPIMLFILPIMLCCSAQKICLLCSKLCLIFMPQFPCFATLYGQIISG